MSDLPPWDGGTQPKKQPSGIKKPGEQPRLPKPDKLPEIYQPDSAAFIAPTGSTVSRPPQTPRPVEKLAKLALLAALGGFILGVLGILFAFTMLDPQAGVIRYIYAAMGGVVAVGALVTLLTELPRLSMYRGSNFLPAVLVYGSRTQMEKVVGPAGLGPLIATKARGSGAGILNKVFDRSAQIASPPEMVALHVDRGSGPELISIDWNSVRELQRGDVVWFHEVSRTNLLMFHKLIPYAPRVMTDAATRKEIFLALKVGANLYRDKIARGATSEYRPQKTASADGLPPQPSRTPSGRLQPVNPAVPLTAEGSFLATDDQPYQGSPGEDEIAPPDGTGPDGTHIYKERETDRHKKINPQNDTEKVAKPWAEEDEQ